MNNRNVVIGAVVVILIIIIAAVAMARKSTPVEAPTNTQADTMNSTDSMNTTDTMASSTSSGTTTTTGASVTAGGVSATATTGTVKSFTVTSKSFSFTPAVMTVKKGDTVKITLNNTEGFHDFKIDEFNVATKRINGAGTDTVEFVASKAGTYEYYCSVGNHRAMGMKGTLTVTE